MSLAIPRPHRAQFSQLKSTRSEHARSVDQVLPSLTSELRQTLGILDGAPRGIAELTIATLGLGSRLTLRGVGVVAFEDNDLEATSLKITKLGHEVIAACAQYAPAREEVAAAREKAVAEPAPVIAGPSDDVNVSNQASVTAS